MKGQTDKDSSIQKICSFMMQYLRKFKTLIAIHIVTLLVYVIGNAYIMVQISKVVLAEKFVLALAFIFAVNVIISLAIRVYHYFVWVWLIPYLQRKISRHILQDSMEYRQEYYDNSFAGDLSKKRTDIILEVPNIYTMLMDGVLFPLGILCANTTGMLILPFKYFIVTIFWCLSFIVLSWAFLDRMNALSSKSAESDARINGVYTDLVLNMLSVKLFHRAKKEERDFEELNHQNMQYRIDLEWLYFYVYSFYSFAFLLVLAITSYWLWSDMNAGIIGADGVVLFLQLILSLVGRFWNLTANMQKILTSFGRVKSAYDKLFKAPTKERNITTGQKLENPRGEIAFNNVSFKYGAVQENVFTNLNVKIKAGEKVGLVGYSGAGKTTLVKLALNIMDVNSGEITIDGKDVSKIQKEVLYEAVSMITQEAMLFHRSVYDNIAYGKENATNDEVVKAAKAAQAHDFIMNLEEGYDTNVGEKGSKLSGGQRQRVMIARSILKDAPIMFLDEVTSQLDTANEEKIQAKLFEVFENKTAIVIAHRLSTLKNMDRLLIFDEGKIVGDGSHEELLESNVLYRSLWARQVF